MKKTMTICGAVLIASLIISSCGNKTIESDAKKCAELTCKGNKLAAKSSAKAASGDMSAITEATQIATEANKLGEEMKDKYKDPADLQKFMEAYSKALLECSK